MIGGLGAGVARPKGSRVLIGGLVLVGLAAAGFVLVWLLVPSGPSPAERFRSSRGAYQDLADAALAYANGSGGAGRDEVFWTPPKALRGLTDGGEVLIRREPGHTYAAFIYLSRGILGQHTCYMYAPAGDWSIEALLQGYDFAEELDHDWFLVGDY